MAMAAAKHLILWIASIILFTVAALGLELLEGNKISTTEYYGLRNIGFIFVTMIFLISLVVYPLLLWPLSWVVQKIGNSFVNRILILLLSGVGGYVFFYESYEDRFIREYHLNSHTAIILFGIAGLIYVMADYYLERRLNTIDIK